MATASMRPFGQRLFGDEIVSLKSFRVKGLPSPPPSLKASSLKVSKSQPFTTILRSNRINTTTFQDISQEFEDVKRATDMGSPPSAPGKSIQSPETTESGVQVDQNPAEISRTKSRLARLLTNKFASRSSSKSPPAQRPSNRALPAQRPSNHVPVVTSAHSKQQRDAALRERGLLPPLKPSKDLSQREREQDKRIPIVPLERVEPGTRTDDPEVVMSAADLVKQEWEAKNRDLGPSQLERLQNFRFGITPSSSSVEETAPTSATVTPVAEASNAADISEESENSQPSPTAFPQVSSAADVSRDSESSQPSQTAVSVSPNAAAISRESESSQLSGTTVLESLNAVDVSRDSESSQPPRTTVSESPNVADVWKESESSLSSQISLFDAMTLSLKALSLITPIPDPPLPRSPAPSDDSLKPALSPTSALLSSSVSVQSTASPSGASTLRPIHTPATTASPTPRTRTPALSLTPPAISTTHSDSLFNETRSCHVRIDSFPLEESVSSTPSLDGTSHTTTNSTPNTSESMGSIENGSFGNLQVKTVDQGRNIPVIIESPVEETFSNGFVAETIMEEKTEEEVPVSSPRTQRRGLTDPTHIKPDPRKPLNPFKRTPGQLDNSDKVSVSKRSVSSSFSSMRRSVVGTLTRKANLEINVNGLKRFNASHRPPSPTVDRSQSPVPTSPRSPSFLNRSRSPALTSPSSPTFQRQAVAPIMYNRGSILLATCNIEDEESRRMTELAFLG